MLSVHSHTICMSANKSLDSGDREPGHIIYCSCRILQLNYLWSASSSTGAISRPPTLFVKISFMKLRAEARGKMWSSVMILAKCGCSVVVRVSPGSVLKLQQVLKSCFCVLRVRWQQQETITLLKEEVAALCADLLQVKESVVALQASKSNSKESNLNVTAGRGIKCPPPPPQANGSWPWKQRHL